jgi:hypothetical protein
MNDQQFNVTLQTLLRRTQGILQLLDTIIKRRGYTWYNIQVISNSNEFLPFAFFRPEVLEQYAVLSTHYFRLCDELNEALFHFVLFPRQLPQDVTWVPGTKII